MENLAHKLDEEKLKEIGSQVVRAYEDDYDSLNEYREHAERQAELVAALIAKKTFPWDGASNIPLPILATAVLQFQSRSRKAILPATGPVHVKKVGQEDFTRAVRVEKWMNYQLYEDMPAWKKEMDMALMRLAVTGTIFKKTFWDELHNRVESCLVEWDDIVMPYGSSSVESAFRKTHKVSMTERDVNRRARKGKWTIEKASELTVELSPKDDKSVGQMDTRDADRDKSYDILEQMCYMELGLEGETEGISHPYIIKVDKASKKVLCIYDNNDSENPDEAREWLTSYICLPNIKSGVYGWGFGVLLEGLNRGANTILNQFVDAATLANVTGGLLKKRSGLKRGDVKFEMGKWQEVDVFGERISDAIYTFDFKGPNPALFQVLGLIFEQAQQVAAVSDISTGQMPPRNTPAATIMALIEQGQMVFSSIHERIHDSFKQELAKIYRLNREHMNWSEYLDVLGDDMIAGIAEPVIMGRPDIMEAMTRAENGKGPEEANKYIRIVAKGIVQNDFRGKSDVIPVSDPNITSNAEKIVKAKEVLDTTLADPRRNQDPQVLYMAFRRYYEAIGIQDIDEINPPPEPPEPPDLPPTEEEARWLTDTQTEVVPGQDHMAHLESHMAFMQSPMAQNLSPHGGKIAEAHIQQTYAAMHREGSNAGNYQTGMVGMA